MGAFTTNPASYIEKDRQVTKRGVYGGSCEAVVPVVRISPLMSRKASSQAGRPKVWFESRFLFCGCNPVIELRLPRKSAFSAIYVRRSHRRIRTWFLSPSRSDTFFDLFPLLLPMAQL
jgi:hypothetical protein